MKPKYQSIAMAAVLLFSGMAIATHSQAAGGLSKSAPADCAPSWSVVPSPNSDTNGDVLYGVTAIAPSDVWAVGYETGGTNTLVEHWNGTSWVIVPSPNPGIDGNQLSGVSAISPSDVWAVGSSLPRTLVEHWDGSSWSVVPSPNSNPYENQLFGVTAISPNDVWAVGYYRAAYRRNTLMEHWDGASWSIIPSPSPGISGNVLYGVSAISPSDIWAVGEEYISTHSSQSLVEHWDGSSWSVVPSPDLGWGNNYLNGITAISPSDVWAVGSYTTSTLVEHWNGTSWVIVPSPNPDPYENQLFGVTAISPSDAWVVGTGPYNTLVEHWDGASWLLVTSPNPGLSSDLHGVAAISSSNVWAVGSQVSGSNSSTLVEHYSGSECGTSTPTPIPQPTICANPFVDISANIFFHAINSLYCQGVINGTDASHYSPGGTASRSQFAKLVVVAFGLPLTTPQSSQSFTDVPPDYWAYLYIESGYAAGILNGFDQQGCASHQAIYPCYLPNLAITRAQLTKLVVSAGGYALITPTSGPTFTDVPPSNVFYVFIETAAANHIISGYPDDTFRPNNPIRRDEMAQIVFTAQQNPAPPSSSTPTPLITATPGNTNTPNPINTPTDTGTPPPSVTDTPTLTPTP